MIALALAAAVSLLPQTAAEAAYKANPTAFCDGVWATSILSRSDDTSVSDTLRLEWPESFSLSSMGGGTATTIPQVVIDCPRPGWATREPKVLEVRPPDTLYPYNGRFQNNSNGPVTTQ